MRARAQKIFVAVSKKSRSREVVYVAGYVVARSTVKRKDQGRKSEKSTLLHLITKQSHFNCPKILIGLN